MGLPEMGKNLAGAEERRLWAGLGHGVGSAGGRRVGRPDPVLHLGRAKGSLGQDGLAWARLVAAFGLVPCLLSFRSFCFF